MLPPAQWAVSLCHVLSNKKQPSQDRSRAPHGSMLCYGPCPRDPHHAERSQVTSLACMSQPFLAAPEASLKCRTMGSHSANHHTRTSMQTYVQTAQSLCSRLQRLSPKLLQPLPQHVHISARVGGATPTQVLGLGCTVQVESALQQQHSSRTGSAWLQWRPSAKSPTVYSSTRSQHTAALMPAATMCNQLHACAGIKL